MISSSSPSVSIVGGGIIGVSCALALQEQGFKVTIFDHGDDISKASYGNAGAIAVTEVMPISSINIWPRLPRWLLDPLGPVSIRLAHLPKLLPWLKHFYFTTRRTHIEALSSALASILSTVNNDLQPLLVAAGMVDSWHRRGAITVYESAQALKADELEWRVKRARGIVVEQIDRGEIYAREPDLAPVFDCAMFTPQWSHVESPYQVFLALSKLFRDRGGRYINCRVDEFETSDSNATTLITDDGARHVTENIVISAGAWSADLCQKLQSPIMLESERGYNTTFPNPAVQINNEVIFAEKKFVMTPLAEGLRVGGAAEFAGLAAAPNYQRSKALAKLAKRYVTGLNTEGGEEWMGHRPATPDSLPVIGRSPVFGNVYFAFGHGHLGLTLAATTAKLITDLVTHKPSSIDIKPFRINRF